MPFDPTEFGLEPDVNPENEFHGVLAPPPQVAQVPVNKYSRRLSEVEAKLLKAQYYRAIMDSGFFDVQDQISMAVENEIKDFVVKRMEELVNGAAPTSSDPETTFTNEEVKYLKLFVVKLKQPRVVAPVSAPVNYTPTPSPVAPVAAPEVTVAAKKRGRARNPTTPISAAPAPTQTPVKRAPGKTGRNASGQVPSTGGYPPPTISQMSALSEMAARQQIMENPTADRVAQAILSK
jgi:hypothetical protein